MAGKWQIIDPSKYPDWDAMVIRHPAGSVFHSSAWGEVMRQTYGYMPCYFVSQTDTEPLSCLPMMEVKSWLTGRRGVGLPFTDESAPLVPDQAVGKELVQQAIAHGRSRGWRYVEFRGGHGYWENGSPSVSFFAHDLDLSGDEEKLFAGLEGSVRRAVRKALKSGLKVEFSNSQDAMREFYELQCLTRRRHGLPPQTLGFFRNLHRLVVAKGMGTVVLARLEGRPIAASVYLWLGDRAVYKYGASDDAFQQYRGSNLVMWEAIKWLAAKGSRTLHFGRTSEGNEGLRTFKLGWGCKEHGIDYYRYDLHQERYVRDKDESSGWHNQFFRKIPAPISRMAGALLYKHWA